MLEQKVEKSVKTTMIGALFIMEEHFGDLLYEPDLAVIFDKVRSDILRLGNNNIRGIKKELSNYKITYKKNRYKFYPGKQEGRENE